MERAHLLIGQAEALGEPPEAEDAGAGVVWARRVGAAAKCETVHNLPPSP